jgi:hypothetical protein
MGVGLAGFASPVLDGRLRARLVRLTLKRVDGMGFDPEKPEGWD